MNEQGAPHLDLDALADALAGAGPDSEHLAGCASCTSRLSELAAAEQRVTAALSGLPSAAMPPELAQRLTAALAAEPALTTDPDQAAAPTRSASVTALPTRTAPHRWLPAAAAAAVLILSAAGLGLAFLPSGGGDQDSSVAAGAAVDDLPVSGTGTDYADDAAVTQVLPGVLAGSAGSADFSLDGAESSTRSMGRTDGSVDPGDQTSGAAGATGEDATAMTEQDSTLMAQVPAPAAAGADPLERLRTPEGLADCLTALLPPEEPDVQPLALDYAQFGGAPALAVVLPDPDPTKISVYVVGPGCTAQDESLLRFLRLDAP